MDPLKTNALFINRVIQVGRTTTITMKSIITITITILMIIGIGLLHGKTENEQENDHGWRAMTTAFLGTGGTLLFCFVLLLSISYTGFTPRLSTKNIIEYFKLAIYLYLYIAYCVVPLIAYVKNNTRIYDPSSVYRPGHTHKYNAFTQIVNIITALLSVCVFLYSVYILLWYTDLYRRRQLLPIFVFGGILCGKFIQELITILGKKN